MILKELNLISFGKFEKERFAFEDGLNIIYGENESGKTTIHNFIYGMFYGFLRPYVRRRLYLDEYEKYRPWNQSQYTGILTFNKEGKLYRIERNFDKGEVKDRLANISTSLEDDISVKNALADLQKRLEDIGTERAPTRPYGRTIKELDELKDKRRQALAKQEECNTYIQEYNLLKEGIKREKSKIEELHIELKKAKILEKKQIYDEAIKLREAIDNINNKIKALKPYSNLSFDDYTIGLKLESQYENLNRQIKELKTKLDSTKYKLMNMKSEKNEGIIKGIKVEDLYKEMDSYNELEDEKNHLILNSQGNRLEILNSELKGILDKEKRSKTQGTIFILLTIASLGLFFINPFLIVLASIPIGLFLYMKKLIKDINQEKNKLKEQIQNIKAAEIERKERISYIEKYQEETILKYNCRSKAEFNRLHDELRLKAMNQSEKQNEFNETSEYLNKISKDLEIKEKEREELKGKLDGIIVKNNSSNMEEFKIGLDKKRDYDNLIKDKDRKIEILDKILGDTNLEELKIELADYDEEYFQIEDSINTAEIVDSIKNRENTLSTMKDRYARLGERIDNLNKDIGKLVDIEEEIYRVEEQIREFDNRIKSINIAKSTIESISQQIHNQFAPTINKEVSQIVDAVTNGKYSQVRIKDDLDITVENPSTKEIIHIESLSGGTIDQLYFALRFSIISAMKGKNLPLILDDCFVQYDNERLGNILKFLSHMSNEKQILLFTCHHREKEILEDLGVKYNLISLS